MVGGEEGSGNRERAGARGCDQRRFQQLRGLSVGQMGTKAVGDVMCSGGTRDWEMEHCWPLPRDKARSGLAAGEAAVFAASGVVK